MTRLCRERTRLYVRWLGTPDAISGRPAADQLFSPGPVTNGIGPHAGEEDEFAEDAARVLSSAEQVRQSIGSE